MVKNSSYRNRIDLRKKYSILDTYMVMVMVIIIKIIIIILIVIVSRDDVLE